VADGAVLAAQLRFAIEQRFAIGQALKDVFDQRPVDMKLRNVTADIFLARKPSISISGAVGHTMIRRRRAGACEAGVFNEVADFLFGAPGGFLARLRSVMSRAIFEAPMIFSEGVPDRRDGQRISTKLPSCADGRFKMFDALAASDVLNIASSSSGGSAGSVCDGLADDFSAT